MYPILGLFLALIWAQSDVRIGEIAEYIESKFERRFEGLKWETHIHQKYKHRSFRLVEASAAGLFVVTQLMAVAFAIPRMAFSAEEIILLMIDGVIMILTGVLLRRRSIMLTRRDIQNT